MYVICLRIVISLKVPNNASTATDSFENSILNVYVTSEAICLYEGVEFLEKVHKATIRDSESRRDCRTCENSDRTDIEDNKAFAICYLALLSSKLIQIIYLTDIFRELCS